MVGENFNFGKNRTGDVNKLNDLGQKNGFSVNSITSIKEKAVVISSSVIRDSINKEKFGLVEKMLGRLFSVLGTVENGQQRGRFIGFPTANIDPHQEVLPPDGVYAVKVKVRNRWYKGMLNIGMRPTVAGDDQVRVVEVNIFNFKQMIYKEDIEVFFTKKIRKERKFPSLNKLRKQLVLDKKRAQTILS